MKRVWRTLPPSAIPSGSRQDALKAFLQALKEKRVAVDDVKAIREHPDYVQKGKAKKHKPAAKK